MLKKLKIELAKQLYAIGAVKIGQFKLKLHEKNPNAPLSPFYIDLRLLRSFPDTMDLAIEIYQRLIKNCTFDLLADVPTAATPIVAILSNKTRVPMISVRLDKKGHGTGASIDGYYKQSQIALVLDDLITGADSKFAAIDILEKCGLKVNNVAVLLDREQGGVKALENKGYNVLYAIGIKEVFSILLDEGKISRDFYKKVIEYLS